jgi:hypothetical protein
MTTTALTRSSTAGLAAPLEELVERARGYAADSRTRDTTGVPPRFWDSFAAWCSGHGLASLPAAPATPWQERPFLAFLPDPGEVRGDSGDSGPLLVSTGMPASGTAEGVAGEGAGRAAGDRGRGWVRGGGGGGGRRGQGRPCVLR